MMGEMRKFMVFALALAMEEDAMNEGMMMEAPAPSVTVGGSGKIGIRNVDDGNDVTDDFKLVRAYKVTFDSTGTTDGGLMFGAGMSIRDDTGEEDKPVVKGSYVFVGGGDGSWKLQFGGGNDPGIDLAGGFGVADDHLGGGNDATIALSGSFGDTSFRITVADPGIEIPARTVSFASSVSSNIAARDAYAAAVDRDNDWSIGVSHSIDTINVGIGMDSEDGLAIGVGTDLSGVSTFVYWSKSEYRNKVFSYGTDINGIGDYRVNQDNAGLGVKASISAGEGATFSVGYSTLKVEQVTSTGTTAASATGNAKTKLIEVDFSYDLGGGATLEVGIDKKDGETLELGPLQGNATVVKSEETTLEAVIAFSF
ncbi:MAG: porin [Rhodobacteraceae bacterium]|nr:porin [Paracoccaceae bacterium]